MGSGFAPIDLATRGTSKSVLEAVRTSINPKIIDCMIEGRETIDGVAKDGIQVKVRARVTVRSNLDRYVRKAQEETVIARVGKHRFHHWLLRELQGGVGKPQFHNRESFGPRIGSRYGLRNTFHRHRGR